MKKLVVVVLVATGISCGSQTDDPEGNPDPEDGGVLNVMVDAEGAEDVESMELTITGCDGGEEVVSEQLAVDRRRALVPSYVQNDDHLFVEEYRTVEPGCYDVEVELLSAGSQPTEECTRAVGRELEVEEGETTEVILYSRCGLEEVKLQIRALEFDPGFRVGCQESIGVCATIDGRGAEVDVSWKTDDESATDIGLVDNDERRELYVECVDWPSSDHGESTGSLKAYPARAETTDGDTVLMYDSHQVSFSTYVECRKDRDNSSVQPPSGGHGEKKIRRIDG